MRDTIIILVATMVTTIVTTMVTVRFTMTGRVFSHSATERLKASGKRYGLIVVALLSLILMVGVIVRVLLQPFALADRITVFLISFAVAQLHLSAFNLIALIRDLDAK